MENRNMTKGKRLNSKRVPRKKVQRKSVMETLTEQELGKPVDNDRLGVPF